MTTSKHVLEIFDLLRNSKDISCIKGRAQEPVGIVNIDTYPEETNVIIQLANGKSITTDDLEFAQPYSDDYGASISLGDYTFILEPRN
jgi:hypothetical protein